MYVINNHYFNPNFLLLKKGKGSLHVEKEINKKQENLFSFNLLGTQIKINGISGGVSMVIIAGVILWIGSELLLIESKEIARKFKISERVISIAYDVVDSYNGSFTIEIDNIVAAGEHGVEVTTPEAYSFHGNASDDNYSLENVPSTTEIVGNYPNPFNPTTQIEFALSNDNAGLVNVAVYDIQGRKVATLHHDVIAAGNHSYTFDASNLSSGQYFVSITAPNFSQTKTMTLLK